MRDVKDGDVVLHFIDNQKFSGVSIAAGSSDDTFQCLPNTAWEGPGYRIQLRDYIPLDPPHEFNFGICLRFLFNRVGQNAVSLSRIEYALIPPRKSKT
jgi:hypothetical protein